MSKVTGIRTEEDFITWAGEGSIITSAISSAYYR